MNIINKRDISLIEEKFGKDCPKQLQQLKDGIPLAYILGEWYFYGLTFKLNRDCLIPRPDTEHLVEKAIELLPRGGVFADLCTGSGCIALSILKIRPDLRAYAADISENALSALKLNADSLGIGTGKVPAGARLEIIKADLLSTDADVILPLLDGVICNPPYIKTGVIPTLGTVKNEPVTALDGGKDGLVFYRRLIPQLKRILKKDGVAIFETGYDQADDVRSIAGSSGMSCTVYKDYGGNDRVAIMRSASAGDLYE